MPAENYYCPDNFFKKMTDLESPKKNNDCYFYYYSTCAKGDNCTFRHEPSALGCETMCSFWKEGKCLNVHCNFRHMELRKNRKVIPCYWESQPVGCLKAHCPFLHQNPRPSDGVSSEKANITAEKSNSDAMLKEQMNQSNERKVTAVDSLVVNFEEESDNESAPTFSPAKSRLVRVKTLEEIKLEKIQAESAAYYSYGQQPSFELPIDPDDLRQRIVRRMAPKQAPPERTVVFKTYSNDRIRTFNKRLQDNEQGMILGDESLRKKQKIIHCNDDGTFRITLNKVEGENSLLTSQDPSQPRQRKLINTKQDDIQNINVKTLAEIRAERNARQENLETEKQSVNMNTSEEEAEVSSTSVDENLHSSPNRGNKAEENTIGRRKIKLRRKLPISEEIIVSSNDKDENMVTSDNENIRVNNMQLNFKPSDDMIATDQKRVETQQNDELSRRYADKSYLNKSEDDVLLSDDDDYENVSLRAEDELLDEIDSLLDN